MHSDSNQCGYFIAIGGNASCMRSRISDFDVKNSSRLASGDGVKAHRDGTGLGMHKDS